MQKEELQLVEVDVCSPQLPGMNAYWFQTMMYGFQVAHGTLYTVQGAWYMVHHCFEHSCDWSQVQSCFFATLITTTDVGGSMGRTSIVYLSQGLLIGVPMSSTSTHAQNTW